MTTRGLYTGFEAYLTPTNGEYLDVLKFGVVVPDTNALLNLYRYTEETREDLFRVFEALGDALWVPHHVVTEFWARREGVLRDRPRDAQNTIRALDKNLDASLQSLRTWAGRISLRDEARDELVADLRKAFERVKQKITEESETGASFWPAARDTGKDPVLARLHPLLEGRVGPALSPGDEADAVTEAGRRRQLRIPPGFMDDSPGDYLIWEQTLRHSALVKKSVAFVTGDFKEDWWREEGGEKRGARLELVDELRARAGVRLFLIRPARLLEIARSVLNIAIDDQSVRVAKRLDEVTGRRGGARRLIVEGEYEQAERLFSRMLDVHPGDGTLYIGRAQARYGLGRLGDALDDLAMAAGLQPDLGDIDVIRTAMVSGTFEPQAAILAQPAVARFVERLSAGDTVEARAAFDEARRYGLRNPAYVCIDRAVLDIVDGDATAALDTLASERPPWLGPYVRVIIEALELLAETARTGSEPDVSRLDASLDACGFFDYRDGALAWAKSGLESRSALTPSMAKVYDHLDKYCGRERTRRRTWRTPSDADVPDPG